MANPTVLTPGSKARIVVQAANLGDAPAVGSTEDPVTVTVKLPPWLRAAGAVGIAGPENAFGSYDFGSEGPNLSCPTTMPAEVLACSYPASLPAFGTIQVFVLVEVLAGAPASGGVEATVEGGGAPAVVNRQAFATGPSTPFGLERFELAPEEEGGRLDTQAGSHPFQLTTTVGLNENLTANPQEPAGYSGLGPGLELPRDVSVKLPPGLVGNANFLPQCTEVQFSTVIGSGLDQCPATTAIGVAIVTLYEPSVLRYITKPFPIFNLTPAPGEPARFGWITVGSPVVLDTSVRTGSDYGITVASSNISQLVDLLKAETVFWGVPGAAEHASSRGWSCIAGGLYTRGAGASPESCEQAEVSPKAFLTLPSSCAGGLQSSAEADSWQRTGVFGQPMGSSGLGAGLRLDGCNRLGFDPSISVAPDGEQASTPTGLTVGVHVPQEDSVAGAGLAETDVKNTTVTLPAGVQLSPSAADGLQGCSGDPADAPGSAGNEIGFTGFTELDPSGEPEVKTVQFSDEEQSCPDASKVATVNISTPLLPNELKGAVYLASPQNFAGFPQENPFKALVAMYLVAKDPVSGTLVKLAGSVTPDPVTGQLTATFENTPQLPFEDLQLHFFGGARAPLATPAFCRDNTPQYPGGYTTGASISAWSGAGVAPSSSFEISSGPNGSACPGAALPFSPSLTAGTTSVNAGGFSPLVTTITREDGQQNIQAVTLHFPPGLSGILAGVKLCPEAQANAGTCGPESRIGSTIVSVGLGGDPFSVTGGQVYLTEKIAGTPSDQPFGLSIVNPAQAGPFVLDEGRPVIVRATVAVDPHTAALTVTTDDTGPYKIPSILDGIPLEIKHVNVSIDGVGGNDKFTFNPTNCGAQQVTGSVDSTEGASANVSVPFQVTNCAALKFAPKFAVSTSGKTSRSQGASLTAKLTYPSTPAGTEANIAKVKVDLPKQLPSRLTTLQKACTNAQFELNPANCPKESKIGYAVVHTPLVPVPLEGPAIFVSHGGEAFPSLTIVLQGYGVTVDLVGTTFISHAGITSTTFKTVPDVPFNTFQLTLPEGKYSALAANGNLCTSKLKMPNEFVGQNGAVIKQSTPVNVTGCAKTKALTRAQKLARALKACRKEAKGKQAACKKNALKRYGPLRKAKKRK
ncbi:MAG TPA: hypothetical protein VII53_06930 [Solirubrobacteraceae bacterium]